MIVKKRCQFVNVSTYNLKMWLLSLRIKIFWLDLVSCCISSFDLDIILFLLLWNWFRMIPLGKSRKFVCFCYFVCLFDETVDWVLGLYSHSFYSTLCPIIDEIFLLFQICFTWNHILWFSGGYVLKSIDFV